MTMLRYCTNAALTIALGFGLAGPTLSMGADTDSKFPSEWMSQFHWRSIGPASMSGRIVSIAVNGEDSSEFWVASASGGLLHTTNDGVSFEHQFDNQNTVSIGNVAVSKSDPKILWVGTGEANPRNSVSYGDGVYKSIDSGKTWEHKGLDKTFQIGRIAIHPDDPNTVYVGALGRLWGPSEDRGLYKTTDGGDTWEKVLYVDDKTGVIDIDMDPSDPYTLIAVTYERQRDGFDSNDPDKKWGPGSGMWKTTDGGKTWKELTDGLPSANLGRVGVDYYDTDPNVVYAIVESERIHKIAPNTAFLGLSAEDADVGARATDITEEGPAATAGLKSGDIILALGDKKIAEAADLTATIRQHRAGDVVTVEYVRDREFHDCEITFGEREDDESLREFDIGLGGQRENLQDQQGFEGHESGGIYRSEDGGDTWARINSLNPRPMYYSQIRVDPSDDNYIYVCGTSLYKSTDGGKTFTGDGGRGGVHVDHHAMWVDPDDGRHIMVGNDGGLYVTRSRMAEWDHLNKFAIGQFYHVTVDPRPAYNVYGGLQDNGSWGGPSRLRSGSMVNSDWFRVGGGDGFICRVDPTDPDQIYFESQGGATGRINLRTGERGFIRPRPPRGVRYRFNWKTPFILSDHNSRIYYSAGNYVFKSLQKGDGMQVISPEITISDKGSGSALGESPRKPNVLYAGTTDGALWRTQDGGVAWTDLFELSEKGLEGATVVTTEPVPSESDEEGAEQPAVASGGGGTAGMLRQMIERLDGNDDGKLQKSEVPERMQGMFDRFDANSDGIIDKNDVVAAEAEGGAQPTIAEGDPVSGTWSAKLVGDNIPAGTDEFTFSLSLNKDDSVSGSFKANVISGDATEGSFNRESGGITVTFEAAQGTVTLTGTIDGVTMKGTIVVGDGLFTVGFEADRGGDASQVASAPVEVEAAAPVSAEEKQPDVREQPEAAAQGEKLAGEWDAELIGDEIPPGVTLTLDFKVNDSGKISGIVSSDQGDADIRDGKFDPATGKFSATISADGGAFEASMKGAVKGNEISGLVSSDMFEFEFKGKRKGGAEQSVEEVTLSPGGPVYATVHPSLVIRHSLLFSDPVSGEWQCEFGNDQFSAEFTLDLKMDASNKVTGTFSSQFSDAEIDSGSFDPKTGKLKLAFSTGRGDAEVEVTIKDKKLSGIFGGGGGFELDVTGTQTKSTAVAEEPTAEGQTEEPEATAAEEVTGPKPINELLPKRMWVSSIEPSRYEDGRVYVTFDGHRSDNDDPWVLLSEDYGATWINLRSNLPRGSTRVVREDIKNENVLYLGTEFGAWVSVDRGASWTAFNAGNLPTVAVHEIAQHPTMGEIVAGTHGRALWILDVSAIRQMTDEALSADRWLFQPQPAYQWRSLAGRGSTGLQEFEGQNPANGAQLYYLLKSDTQNIRLYVQDIRGKVIRELEAPGDAGLHHVTWDLRRASPQQGRGSGGPRGGGGRGRGRFRSSPIEPGQYLVILEVGDDHVERIIDVRDDPDYPNAAFAIEQEEAFNAEMNAYLQEVEGERIDH